MKRRKIYLFVVVIGAGLTACSSYLPTKWKSEVVMIHEGPVERNVVDSIMNPYRDSIKEDMSMVVGRTPETLERGRPCGTLNNWTADALMVDQMEKLGIDKNFMVLLNVGGLRSPINKGDITMEDMFTLMPFDNEIVWVKMPMTSLQEIARYLMNSGGEPIANAQLNDGKLSMNLMDKNSDEFWIITSDYLMNGGDNMTFFQKKLDVVFTGDLLREAFIRQSQKQGNIQIDKTCRINVD